MEVCPFFLDALPGTMAKGAQCMVLALATAMAS